MTLSDLPVRPRPGAAPAEHPATDPTPAPTRSTVAVVIDDTLAAVGAARWAAAVAAHADRDLLAVVLLPPGEAGPRAVLGRVEPTLRGAGTPLTVAACRVPPARSLHEQSAQTAAAVRRCLAAAPVELLVLPGDRRLADPRWRRHSLVTHLERDRAYDVLVVPGLGGTPARRAVAVGGYT